MAGCLLACKRDADRRDRHAVSGGQHQDVELEIEALRGPRKRVVPGALDRLVERETEVSCLKSDEIAELLLGQLAVLESVQQRIRDLSFCE